jgi:DNA-binding beta-propeller fold protein YncE
MLPAAGWKNECRPEGQASAAPNHTQGALFVIDVTRARRGQSDALVTRLPAGCNPVRVALSPTGANAYVTARGENNLVVFDTRKMITDSAHAIVAKVPAGIAPVGVAVFEDGRSVVVTNSNRFNGGPNDAQPLTVVDATRVAARSAAVRGTIQAGAFPRELRVTADGKTLLVTNFNSKTVQLVDIARMTLR